MRLKQGFKASCSSMAFIVNKNTYGSIFNLAKAMIKARGFDDDAKLIKKLERLEKSGMNADINLAFGTINYDTYMALVGDDIWVETSNNHDYWDTIEKDTWIGEDEEHPIWAMRKDLSFFNVFKGTIQPGRTHSLIDGLRKRVKVLENQIKDGLRK